jgi:hypothetical protein
VTITLLAREWQRFLELLKLRELDAEEFRTLLAKIEEQLGERA